MSLYKMENNNLVKVSGGGNTAINNYSLEEQAIGTWIDGKIIYRKVITCASYEVTEDYINTGFLIGNIKNIDNVIGYQGMCQKGNDFDVPLVYYQFDSTINYESSSITNLSQSYISQKYKPICQLCVWWRVRSTGEIFIRAVDSLKNIILILEYTKL